MSSIPNSAMPHAHVHHDAPPAKPVEGRVARLLDTVKAHPRTGLAVGASLGLGAVAAVALPAASKPKPAPRKRAPTKPKAKAKPRAKATPTARRKTAA